MQFLNQQKNASLEPSTLGGAKETTLHLHSCLPDMGNRIHGKEIPPTRSLITANLAMRVRTQAIFPVLC